ncbi:MAG: hypothetical protein F9K25_01975 [Candidatus Contendobacter sp.]|nr:MAG: hypothetical protein F9K25_01975 [Candidatus Contendobacter sp.]
MSRSVLTSRSTAIGETRTLAIFSMMIGRFGPSAFQRLPALQPLAEPILFLGRFANTTFIVVFGVTVGFVYFDRFLGPDRVRVLLEAVHARARLRVLCALIIRVPDYVNLGLAGDFDSSR